VQKLMHRPRDTALLGRGGMGLVFKARQTGLKRHVALKIVVPGAHAGAEERARFRIPPSWWHSNNGNRSGLQKAVNSNRESQRLSAKM